jgi:hypothetical protein
MGELKDNSTAAIVNRARHSSKAVDMSVLIDPQLPWPGLSIRPHSCMTGNNQSHLFMGKALHEFDKLRGTPTVLGSHSFPGG